MKRRNFLTITALTSSGLLLSPVGRGTLVPQDAGGNLHKLNNQAGIYTERGGTIGYLSTPEGIVVIDSQFPEQAGHFIQKIRESFSDRFVLLMNTHHHGDHTGGNIAFKPYISRVVAHVNSAKYQRIIAEQRGTRENQYYPTETFKQEWKDTFGGVQISARYFGRAHTSGDAIIHFENENIVHMGDLVFNRLHPYIDRGAGASIQNWIEVLETAVKTYGKKAVYIFGHARDPERVTGPAEDLDQMKDYLDALLETARKAISAGKTKKDLTEVKELRGYEDYTGSRLKNNLEAAWEELHDKES